MNWPMMPRVIGQRPTGVAIVTRGKKESRKEGGGLEETPCGCFSSLSLRQPPLLLLLLLFFLSHPPPLGRKRAAT